MFRGSLFLLFHFRSWFRGGFSHVNFKWFAVPAALDDLRAGRRKRSQALSKWIGQEVRLSISEVELVELDKAAEVLGPPETLVAACAWG